MKINIVYALLIMVMFFSCKSSSKEPSSSISEKTTDDSLILQKNNNDTIKQDNEELKTNSNSYDNMKGFDPPSEDDMDDNGMRRYMENNDEEGWS